MTITVADIARALEAEFVGDGTLPITGLAEPQDAGPHDLALAMQSEFAENLSGGAARAAVLYPGADWRGLGLDAAIEAPRARLALAKLTRLLDTKAHFTPGVSAHAVISESAEIAEDATIGPFCDIGEHARLGHGVKLAARVSIGADVCIGPHCHLHSNVTILPGVKIGAGVIIHAGTVIGSDGFSYVTEQTSHPERVKTQGGGVHLPPYTGAQWHKIQSLGGVVIGDDVEIGANCTIDAGTIRPTAIGARTKLDNLVHIAHNCVIGEDTLICAQVGLAGSARIGDRVVLAGQVGVGDHHFVGNDVVAGGASKIMTNVPAGRAVLGYPAQRMDKALDGFKALRRLARKPISKRGTSD